MKCVIRARVVATMRGAPIENGAVVIDGENIVDVGAFSELRAESGHVVDLGESVLLPGLINAHCHLDYTCLRGKIPRQRSFADWVRAINDAKAQLMADDYVHSINDGFAEARKFGTTTVVNYTAFPEFIARVDQRVTTIWCAELIDVRPGSDANKTVSRADEQLRGSDERGFAPHALYTASPAMFRRVQQIAAREQLLCSTHVAESFDEMQMFRYGSGGLYDFLAALGRDMSDCGTQTPCARALALCSSKTRWIFAHMNELSDDDFALIAQRAPLHIAHCPRSHAYFQHKRFAFERLRDAGANVCLGTDSLASAPDLNLFAEMREFRRLRPHVTARETLEMVTVNAAGGLPRRDKIGQLAAGFRADMIALPFNGKTREVFDAVVDFDGAVPWMMLAGTAISA